MLSLCSVHQSGIVSPWFSDLFHSQSFLLQLKSVLFGCAGVGSISEYSPWRGAISICVMNSENYKNTEEKPTKKAKRLMKRTRINSVLEEEKLTNNHNCKRNWFNDWYTTSSRIMLNQLTFSSGRYFHHNHKVSKSESNGVSEYVSVRETPKLHNNNIHNSEKV